jgi:hypothetical protein
MTIMKKNNFSSIVFLFIVFVKGIGLVVPGHHLRKDSQKCSSYQMANNSPQVQVELGSCG